MAMDLKEELDTRVKALFGDDSEEYGQIVPQLFLIDDREDRQMKLLRVMLGLKDTAFRAAIQQHFLTQSTAGSSCVLYVLYVSYNTRTPHMAVRQAPTGHTTIHKGTMR